MSKTSVEVYLVEGVGSIYDLNSLVCDEYITDHKIIILPGNFTQHTRPFTVGLYVSPLPVLYRTSQQKQTEMDTRNHRLNSLTERAARSSFITCSQVCVH